MEQSPKVTHTVMPLCVQFATIHVKARVVKRAWLADQWGGFSRWFLLVYISFMTLSQRYHKHRICFFRESQKETKVSPEIHSVIFSPIPLYPSSSYTRLHLPTAPLSSNSSSFSGLGTLHLHHRKESQGKPSQKPISYLHCPKYISLRKGNKKHQP